MAKPQIVRIFKRYKQGIKAGALIGAILAFYIKLVQPSLQAVSSGGLIEKVVTLSPANMAFLKVLIVSVVMGALVGLLIQAKVLRK